MITEHPTATVVSNKDPAKAGRIKVEMAELDGDQWPEWLEPIWPGGQWICIPEPGDTVECVIPEGEDKIEFAGEVKYRGVILDPKNTVPSEFKTNYPNRRGFKTKAGHLLIVDDKAGTITVKNGSTGDAIEMSKLGATRIDGKTNIVLDTPAVKLGGSTAVQFLVKGTLFMAGFGAYLNALNTAATTWNGGSKTPADVVTFINAFATAITTLYGLSGAGSGSTWLSTVSATE